MEEKIMMYTMNGFETVNFDENEIRQIADSIDLAIADIEKNYLFEDKFEVLNHYNELKEKIAKVAGWQ